MHYLNVAMSKYILQTDQPISFVEKKKKERKGNALVQLFLIQNSDPSTRTILIFKVPV